MSRKINLQELLKKQKDAKSKSYDIIESGNAITSKSKPKRKKSSKSKASKTDSPKSTPASSSEGYKSGASKTDSPKSTPAGFSEGYKSGASKTDTSANNLVSLPQQLCEKLITENFTAREIKFLLFLALSGSSPSLEDIDLKLGYSRSVTLKTIKSLVLKKILVKSRTEGRYAKTKYEISLGGV